MDVSTVADLARNQARLTPNRTALVFQERRTSFAELDRRANQVAHGLLAAGAHDQGLIAVLDQNNDYFYEICIGAARVNAGVVPLDPSLSMQDLLQILRDCKPRALFVGAAYTPLIDQLGLELYFLDFILEMGTPYELWRDVQPWREPGVTIDGSGISLLLYAGIKYGAFERVLFTHEHIFHKMAAVGWEEGGLVAGNGEYDIALICLPNAHAGGSVYGLTALSQGAQLVIGPEVISRDIAALIDRERVTRSLMMPEVIPELLVGFRSGIGDYETLRKLLFVAVPMPTVLLLSALFTFTKTAFSKLYGLTESCGPVCYLDENDHRAIAAGNLDLARSCGRPISGVDVRVVDEKGSPLTAGRMGEINYRITKSIEGSWGEHDENQPMSQEGWRSTRDVGFMDTQGYVFIHDPERDTIFFNGVSVNPAEIETVLYAHPAIADIAVIGVPDVDSGESIKAVAVLRSGAVLQPIDLITYAQERLSAIKVPTSVDFVETLPRSPNGRVFRWAVRERYWEHSSLRDE